MLEAELDLEMKNLLSMALESEMTRLDDSGMHRSDANLVNFLALDAIK